jgi:hypothetical protein
VVTIDARLPLRPLPAPSTRFRRAAAIVVVAALVAAGSVFGFALGRQAALDNARSGFAAVQPQLAVAAAADQTAWLAYESATRDASGLSDAAAGLSAEATGRADTEQITKLGQALSQLDLARGEKPGSPVALLVLNPDPTVSGYSGARDRLSARLASARTATDRVTGLTHDVRAAASTVRSSVVAVAQSVVAAEPPLLTGRAQVAATALFTALSLIQPDGPKASLVQRYATPGQADELISALEWYLETTAPEGS